jgi:Arc/MetJ-type ribon-helix-helix transcriptional regulator
LTGEYYSGDTQDVTKRIAVSLPDELFRRMERVRKGRRVARSKLVQEALGEYVERRDEQTLEKAYFDGYRRIPDGDDPDFVEIERAGIEDLKKANLA